VAKAKSGALVLYCGHEACFVADIHVVGNTNVVRANGPVTMSNVDRVAYPKATHHLMDWPTGGFWRPDLGVFVVPQSQVKELKPRTSSARTK
jgi:hypothetical protein